ncbi:MAG TPA: serine hydrolase, partial [Vicinamibacteria bacterium]
GGVLPLRDDRPLRLLHLVLSSDAHNDAIQGWIEEELKSRRIPADTLVLGPEVSDETARGILASAPGYTHVLASCFVRVRAAKGTVDMSASHERLLRSLAGSGPPVVLVSFGSPYLLAQAPGVQAYVCAFSSAESSQRAAVGALFGEYPVSGHLPVTLPGLYDRGWGISIPRREMTLCETSSEDVGFTAEGWEAVARVVQAFVEKGAFPGAVLAVGREGRLAPVRPFGRLSYEGGAAETRADTIYDLASLTKVVATTTMAMILVDEGRVDLDAPVASFLPAFKGGAKDRVTLRHLLTHSSGLDWWKPLYEEISGREAYVDRIERMDLAYEPGTRSLYSDLGTILLGEVLERVSGESLDAFAARHVFEPLGMRDTLFRPGPELLPRIAPTEREPWRGRLLRGEVHDANAYAMGGVAPHAGLFGTAPDLARFAQMLLNGGVYDHRRIVSRATLERFTRSAGISGSRRGLGWDTWSPGSSAGTLFSPRSFGHTGFTGTSLWIDPDRGLFLILLTNRVHPTRENDAIRRARPAVADAVIRALR